MGFEGLFLKDGRVFDVAGEGVPEAGCSRREGPVTPGPELSPGGL